MKAIAIKVDGFDFDKVVSHLMQLSKDEGMTIQVE
jgi:hypothetical protein